MTGPGSARIPAFSEPLTTHELPYGSTEAAVVALLVALLLVYPAAIVRFYFFPLLPGRRPRWRAAVLEILAGVLLVGEHDAVAPGDAAVPGLA